MTRYAIALLLLALIPINLTAQDAEPADGAPTASDNREVTIILEEPAKTVEDALERRAAKEAEAQKQLDVAQKLFDDTMAAADRHAVADLSVIARQAVADGRLGDAAKSWAEIERLDPENEQAKAFFKVVGRPEPEQKKSARNRSDKRRVWVQAATRKPLFAIQPNGNWIQIMGNRTKEWTEVDRIDGIIFMRRPDGLELRLHENAFYWKGKDSNSWTSSPIGYWR